jgi:hypothetical protein
MRTGVAVVVVAVILWTTPIHEDLLDQSFPGLPLPQRQVLKAASARVDNREGQQAVNSYRHAMRAPGQSVEEARRLAENFVRSNRDQARRSQALHESRGGKGMSSEALDAVGNLLHTISDSTSPMHQDFPEWYWWQGVQHWLGERAISPERRQQAIEALRAAYGETFGPQRLAEAIQ